MFLSPSAPAGDRPVAPAFLYMPPAAAAVLALGPRDCRWPLGEPSEAGFAFCGALHRLPGRYCAAHVRMARQGSASRAVAR